MSPCPENNERKSLNMLTPRGKGVAFPPLPQHLSTFPPPPLYLSAMEEQDPEARAFPPLPEYLVGNKAFPPVAPHGPTLRERETGPSGSTPTAGGCFPPPPTYLLGGSLFPPPPAYLQAGEGPFERGDRVSSRSSIPTPPLPSNAAGHSREGEYFDLGEHCADERGRGRALRKPKYRAHPGPSRERRLRAKRRQPSPPPLIDDEELALYHMPMPHHGIPVKRSEEGDGRAPTAFDRELARRLQRGASARRLLSLRDRQEQKYKVTYLGKKVTVTCSADPTKGGYVLEGEGLEQGPMPKDAFPPPSFVDHKGELYWDVEKIHAKRFNATTGKEEYLVEWVGWPGNEWLPRENVGGLPDARELDETMGGF